MTAGPDRVWLQALNGDRSWIYPPTPFAQQPDGPLERPEDDDG